MIGNSVAAIALSVVLLGCEQAQPDRWGAVEEAGNDIDVEVEEPQADEELEAEQESGDCDPSYPDVCVPPYPPDLDCGEVGFKNFSVSGDDPHGFDRDGDGVGCES